MKKTNQKSKSNSAVFLLALALVCLVAVPATSSANSDGEAIFVLGTASLIKGDGSEVMLTKGDAVNEGDTVSTSKNGQVQLRMSDGGLIAVRPASEFLITAYKHNGGAQDKSFFKLVKGSFRSLTGAIGKTNKQAYRVQTPVATIGIRGTDYTARYCAGDCVDAVNGLYVGVMSGGVVVDNGVAGLDVNPGEFGFVADTVSEPVLLDSAPGNLLFASTGTSDSTNTSSASNSDAALAVMGTDSSGVNTEFTTATIYGSTSVAVSKIAISSTGTTGLYDSATGGTVVSSSAPNTDGISWGVWSAGSGISADTSGSGSTVIDSTTEVHWISGTLEDSAALASAGTYTFSGGTNPTDTTNGVTGTLSAASMSVDFSSNLVTSLSFQITAAETWDSVLTSPASINSDGSFTGTLTTDINDSGVITTGSGAVAGGFSGTLDSMGVPSGAYFGYNVTGTSSFTGTNTTRDWQGAVALTRQ